MTTLIHAAFIGIAAIALGSWTDSARAEGEDIVDPAAFAAAKPAAPASIAKATVKLGAAVDLTKLDSRRGGTSVENDMKLSGVVADNQASHLTTGSNLISEGAFGGSSGMPMVVQNSGNNVLIQNATIVNVQVK